MLATKTSECVSLNNSIGRAAGKGKQCYNIMHDEKSFKFIMVQDDHNARQHSKYIVTCTTITCYYQGNSQNKLSMEKRVLAAIFRLWYISTCDLAHFNMHTNYGLLLVNEEAM